MFGKPGLGHHAEKDIPEKFLVTSKVVNIAPCSDRKEGKRKEMMMGKKERRERKIDYKVAARKSSTAKGQLEGFREQGIISELR